MKVILYQTNFGTSERYAKTLSEKTGLPYQALKDADVPAGSEVILIAPILSNELQGLSQARQRGLTLLAVGAVGLFSVTEPVEEMQEKLKVHEPLFLLPGAFDPHKVKGVFRMMIGMVKHALKSKSTGSEAEQKALDFFDSGADLFDEAALDALIDCLHGIPCAESEPEGEAASQ